MRRTGASRARRTGVRALAGAAIFAALAAAGAARADSDACPESARPIAIREWELTKNEAKLAAVDQRVDFLRKVLLACGIASEAELGAVIEQGWKSEFASAQANVDRGVTLEGGGSTIHRLEEAARRSGNWTPELERRVAVARAEWQGRVLADDRARKQKVDDQCGHKDYRDLLPPIRSQDSIGWCYAFAAADLLSAHLHQPVSAFDLALGYNSSLYAQALKAGTARAGDGSGPDPSLDGGEVETAITGAQKEGFCSEADLPSFVNGAPNLARSVQLLARLPKLPDLPTHPGMACSIAREIRPYFTGLPMRELIDILAVDHGRGVADRLRARVCKTRVTAPAGFHVATTHYPAVYLRANEQIQKSLLAGRPVAVTLKMDELLKYKPSWPYHAMVVVGQELNPATHRCEFILRNSWGKVCAPFKVPQGACQGGYVHIQADRLAAAVLSTTEIDKP